ncbi:MAG: ASKHA domain-containing protein [Dehalococcoidia bacterium]|nr:ASKHA domain-containing protein [Dehalococcoidia bacterium]
MTVYIVYFEPVGRKGECRANQSLLDCAHRLGMGIASLCGGQGTCHSCKIQLLSGTVSAPTGNEREVFSSEELKDGWRLACQTYPASDCKLNVPSESMTTTQRTQVEGLEITVAPEPPVQAYHLKLAGPSLSNPQADAEHLLQELNHQHHLHCNRVDIDVMRLLSPQLRSWKWQCQTSVRDNEVIALGPWPSRQLGLAVDLGTTKIASYLIDLSDGRTLAAKGDMNPQIRYGEDIISRINSAIKSPKKGVQLQQITVEALNQLVADLCADIHANTEEIVEAVVVGNTAMHHLFLGLPVRQLALSPFVPAVTSALDIKARDLGLHIAAGAYVHLLPNIAGFVGADHVAMLLATNAWQAEGITVALDIGTNTEVSLIAGGKITTVSCASGPAFEGYHIKHGMRAASGAIERVQLADDNIQYQTVDKAPPVGICGSGILDAIAQLYLAGVINEGGRMLQSHPRVRNGQKQREFVLIGDEERSGQPAIVITQQDVRELQLAKSAIRTGIQVLLDTGGYSEDEISQVTIAGAFGTYIDVSSAITTGMLPAIPLNRFQQVGNAAGMGAKMALISLSKRADGAAVASRVRYIELASAPDFTQTFVQAGYLGRYRIRHGNREKID